MATFYPSITEEQAELIRNAPMFFVATVDPTLADGPNGTGPVNLSPKGRVPPARIRVTTCCSRRVSLTAVGLKACRLTPPHGARTASVVDVGRECGIVEISLRARRIVPASPVRTI